MPTNDEEESPATEPDAGYARAAREGRRAARTEPRATAARYEPSTRSLVVELASGASLAVEVTPGGEGLHLPALDADLGVPGLVAGVFGSRRWMRELERARARPRARAPGREPPENLAEAVRRRFAPLGGVELEPLPREPGRESPRFGDEPPPPFPDDPGADR